MHAALRAMRRGGMVVVVDEHGGEGSLVIGAESVTPEQVAFLVRHTSGLICVPLEGARLDSLQLPPAVPGGTDGRRTAFTVSVDHASTTLGMSAADRARTIRALVEPGTRPQDLTRPGHVFPLRYRPGGVLARCDHAEAAVDLARMAGLEPAAVMSHIVKDDGSMAGGTDLRRFAMAHDLPVVVITDLAAHRLRHEDVVHRLAEARIPTPFGSFQGIAYESTLDDLCHLALVRGQLYGKKDVLVGVHVECLFGDAFASLACGCSQHLDDCMRTIAGQGEGAIIYLRAQGNTCLAAPERDACTAAHILADLGLSHVRLLSTDPGCAASLRTYGIEPTGVVGVRPATTTPPGPATGQSAGSPVLNWMTQTDSTSDRTKEMT